MTFRKQSWLLIPLVAALGCAGSGQSQKSTQAGGKSTLVDEGPGSGASKEGAVAAGAAGAAAGQGANAELVPFHGANGFTVLMPPNPQTDNRTQETPGGQVQVHIAQAQDASGKYMSSLSEFPPGSLDRVKRKDLLDSLQQATVQSMGGTLVNSQDVQAGGLAGREFTATDPEGSDVTARVFVGESRVYTIAGTYPKGQMPPSIQQFLGSFQPPAASATGGSGSPDNAAAVDMTNAAPGADGTSGDSVSGTSSDSATSVPAEPKKSSKKKSRSSSSASAGGSSSDLSGSR